MSAYTPVPFDKLSPLGRRHRLSEMVRDEFGLRWDDFTLLVVLVARSRYGLTTTRAEVMEFLREEDGIRHTPGFDQLRRLGFARNLNGRRNSGVWCATHRALQRLAWAGREASAAE